MGEPRTVLYAVILHVTQFNGITSQFCLTRMYHVHFWAEFFMEYGLNMNLKRTHCARRFIFYFLITHSVNFILHRDELCSLGSFLTIVGVNFIFGHNDTNATSKNLVLGSVIQMC